MSHKSIPTCAAIALGLSFPALLSAEIKLNDNLTLSGYVTGTAARSTGDIDAGGGSFSTETLEVDSMKLALGFSFEKTTGQLSLHSFGDSDPVFLDAYATYDLGGGSSMTFGKFLSYLGYEAFDYPNMLQISYANSLAGIIPAYHAGVRYDYAGEGFSGGFALLDSVYGPTYYEGDHDLGGFGMEGYLKFSADAGNLFLAFAHDSDNTATGVESQTTFDIWADTTFGSTTLAAEFAYADIDAGGASMKSHFWLLLAMQSFDKWSVTGRLSGGVDETVAPDAEFIKYTISPAVVLTDNLAFLFEYSYINYDDTADLDNEDYLAAQFVFKF